MRKRLTTALLGLGALAGLVAFGAAVLIASRGGSIDTAMGLAFIGTAVLTLSLTWPAMHRQRRQEQETVTWLREQPCHAPAPGFFDRVTGYREGVAGDGR